MIGGIGKGQQLGGMTVSLRGISNEDNEAAKPAQPKSPQNPTLLYFSLLLDYEPTQRWANSLGSAPDIQRATDQRE